jgi:transposase InsO family protein
VWLYVTKTTNAAKVLRILKKQTIIFGNPRRIISDRGAAFTSNNFQSYSREENIEHVLITTRMPRSNGQVERVNCTLIPLLSKLADPHEKSGTNI